MKASTALLHLFKEEQVWRQFFRSCCEISTHRLSTQTWLFRDELKDRGYPYRVEEVEDALLGLARDLLPQSPTAQWDTEWAHVLCKDALARLAEHYAVLSVEEKATLDLSAQTPWDDRMVVTGVDNDPAAFRVALKGWEQVGLRAMKQIGTRGGAA